MAKKDKYVSVSAPASPRGGKHKNSDDKIVENSLISNALLNKAAQKVIENVDGHYVLSPVLQDNKNERNLQEYILVPNIPNKHGHKRSDSSAAKHVNRESKIYNKSPLPDAKVSTPKEQKTDQLTQETKVEQEKKASNFDFPNFSAKSILTKPGKNKEKLSIISSKKIDKNDENLEEINQQNLDKALLEATKKVKNEDIEKSIDLGANVNCTDNNGDTPIILAVTSKNYGTARILLKLGADIRQTNKAGFSAFDKSDDNFKLIYDIISTNNKHLKTEFCKQIITICQQNEQQSHRINKLENELKQLETMVMVEGLERVRIISKLQEVNIENKRLNIENFELANKHRTNDSKELKVLSENKQKILEDKTFGLQVQLFKLVEQIHDIQQYLFKTDPNYERVVAVDGSTIIVQPVGEYGYGKSITEGIEHG